MREGDREGKKKGNGWFDFAPRVKRKKIVTPHLVRRSKMQERGFDVISTAIEQG